MTANLQQGDQLRHLIEVTQEYPVAIYVLPFGAGASPGSDNLVIFEFPDALDSAVVYVESDTAQRMHEDRHPVRLCTYTPSTRLWLTLSRPGSPTT